MIQTEYEHGEEEQWENGVKEEMGEQETLYIP